MSGVNYLDGDTERKARQALKDGKTLEYVAGYLHMDTEYLGRLLQLPARQAVPVTTEQPEDYLWSTDRLDAQL